MLFRSLLEVSRQRLRPSLNESYDIEHVLVRGTRSLGLSILRIIGEDAAKDNTGEIHVYVPSDVASYLLNEKRYDIINIERSNGIKVLVIADPYKMRPYYKVVRVKSSEIVRTDSYKLTPKSPEPGIDWRDNKKLNVSKPMVRGVKPPKMPKKKKEGLMTWLRSITGIQIEEPDNKKKTKTRKKFQNNKKKIHDKNLAKPKKTFKSKKPVKAKSKNIAPTDKKRKVDHKNKKPNKKLDNSKSLVSKANLPKKSNIKEIVVEKKVKKQAPTRAKNDPRQKN